MGVFFHRQVWHNFGGLHDVAVPIANSRLIHLLEGRENSQFCIRHEQNISKHLIKRGDLIMIYGPAVSSKKQLITR